jgi:signal transduction histidine kinase
LQVKLVSFDSNRVQLTVADDGHGIPTGSLNKIFDPFFTTRLGQGGSGLGLTIVHNLVTVMLGGRIEVASTVGQGTCFTLSFPRAAPVQTGIDGMGGVSN